MTANTLPIQGLTYSRPFYANFSVNFYPWKSTLPRLCFFCYGGLLFRNEHCLSIANAFQLPVSFTRSTSSSGSSDALYPDFHLLFKVKCFSIIRRLMRLLQANGYPVVWSEYPTCILKALRIVTIACNLLPAKVLDIPSAMKQFIWSRFAPENTEY